MPDAELSSFIDQVTGGARLRVDADLGEGFVRLRVSEAERRQAKQDIRCVEDAAIEMLRNARDAHAHVIFFGTARSGNTRRIVMVDDGDGVPERLQETIFEPRVTSKLDSMSMDEWGVHGRGMALYSIRENAERAVVAASVVGQGSAFCVDFDVQSLSERSDQSTLPALVKDDEGAWQLGSSPHNIARASAAFALSSREACTVYYGSIVEAAATMYAFGRQFLKSSSLSLSATPAEVAPAKRLALAGDATEFCDIARVMGLEMSSRSAQRILQGQVQPLTPLLDMLARETAPTPRKRKKADLSRDFRSLKIQARDLETFRAALSAAYRELAELYYLDGDVEPELRMCSDGLRVTFPVRHE